MATTTDQSLTAVSPSGERHWRRALGTRCSRRPPPPPRPRPAAPRATAGRAVRRSRRRCCSAPSARARPTAARRARWETRAPPLRTARRTRLLRVRVRVHVHVHVHVRACMLACVCAASSAATALDAVPATEAGTKGSQAAPAEASAMADEQGAVMDGNEIKKFRDVQRQAHLLKSVICNNCC